MPLLTFIARVSDGMILVASMESSNDNALSRYKLEAKQILKTINARSPTQWTIESGSSYAFHSYLAHDICYLTLTTASYPKRLVFTYLSDLDSAFVRHCESLHGPGSQWTRYVATVARPYAFITFDKNIQSLAKDFSDPRSRSNVSKVNDNLQDIHNIMRQNIQEVLMRGEKLERVSAVSSDLADRSKEFKWGAKKLSLQALYRQYGPLVAVGLLIFIVIYIKFF